MGERRTALRLELRRHPSGRRVREAPRLRALLGPDTHVAANAFTPPSEAWALAGRQGDDPIARRRDMAPRGRGREDDLFVHDQRTYLQGILQRQDRMSMAAAVEMREPLLDHHLVEWANGLPSEVKLAGGVTKSLLRDVAVAWLPRSVVDRPKNGFAVPTGAWMMPGCGLGDRVTALTDAGGPLAGVIEVGARLPRTQDGRRASPWRRRNAAPVTEGPSRDERNGGHQASVCRWSSPPLADAGDHGNRAPTCTDAAIGKWTHRARRPASTPHPAAGIRVRGRAEPQARRRFRRRGDRRRHLR